MTTSSGRRPPRYATCICAPARHRGDLHRRENRHPGQVPQVPREAAAAGLPGPPGVEYVRNGTVSIVAALHVATGQVVTEPIVRNDSITFTGFLHRLDQGTDPRLNIHIIMDNGSSHTSKATRAWIAAHPRIIVTYTPKHASWLDMAELWFSVLTRGLLRRGEFTSRDDLTEKITNFAIRYNQTAKPWIRAYDARDDHARYRARHSSQHPAQVTAQPATPQTLPQAAEQQSPAKPAESQAGGGSFP